jgi:hypothetical protein
MPGGKVDYVQEQEKILVWLHVSSEKPLPSPLGFLNTDIIRGMGGSPKAEGAKKRVTALVFGAPAGAGKAPAGSAAAPDAASSEGAPAAGASEDKEGEGEGEGEGEEGEGAAEAAEGGAAGDRPRAPRSRPSYPESLKSRGLVACEETGHGIFYKLTEEGKEEAARLAAANPALLPPASPAKAPRRGRGQEGSAAKQQQGEEGTPAKGGGGGGGGGEAADGGRDPLRALLSTRTAELKEAREEIARMKSALASFKALLNSL